MSTHEEIQPLVTKIVTDEELTSVDDCVKSIMATILSGLADDVNRCITAINSAQLTTKKDSPGKVKVKSADKERSHTHPSWLGEIGTRAVQAATIGVGVASGIIVGSVVDYYLHLK